MKEARRHVLSTLCYLGIGYVVTCVIVLSVAACTSNESAGPVIVYSFLGWPYTIEPAGPGIVHAPAGVSLWLWIGLALFGLVLLRSSRWRAVLGSLLRGLWKAPVAVVQRDWPAAKEAAADVVLAVPRLGPMRLSEKQSATIERKAAERKADRAARLAERKPKKKARRP